MIVGPLHHYHERAGARFLEWGGWRLPAAFTSPADEVCRVRTAAGYTDFPFLNHIVVRGPDAFVTLQRVITRDLNRCPVGKALYTLALNEEGSVIDDGIVMRLAEDFFVVSVPCRNPMLLPKPLDFLALKQPKAWIRPDRGAQVCIHELGAYHVSVQGPHSRDLMRPAIDLTDLPLFGVRETRVRDVPVIVSRTGFSGELGFEFLVWAEHEPALWEMIVELGEAYGAAPYGMEATLTMGLEKGFVMGRDFFPGSTPLEVGLDWAVDLDKREFVGKHAVLRRRDEGLTARLVGLELQSDSPVPAADDPVWLDGRMTGKVTNAVVSALFDRVLARAWLAADVESSTQVEIMTGNTRSSARVCRDFRWYDPLGVNMRI